ncbi:MAG: alcohol dehydrogenase, partial [Phycisphaerae bacterium]|nr:alcohol dehydrogenase [Phycisphaerae bacterium]
PGGLALAMQMARPRATILTLSTPSTAPGASGGSGVDLSPGVVNELTIQGVRGGRLAEGLELLAQRRVDVLSLITARFPITHAREAIARAASGLRVLLTFA